MSTKKEELKFDIGQLVKVDYSPEIDRRTVLNERQLGRNLRPGIIVNIVEKESIGDFNSFGTLYRYEVLVGRELIEIDQKCLVSID